MAFDSFETGTLDVFSPAFGGSLVFPKGFWEPGTASIHKLHCGQGASLQPFTASLVVGPSLTSPLSINTVGLEQLTGIRNCFGSDIKIGSDISLGALNISYSSVFSEKNGLKDSVTPAWSATSPIIDTKGLKTNFQSPNGDLSGFWKYNGVFVSVGPHTSDVTLKKNIEPLKNSLSRILNLRPVSFNWDEEIVPTLAKEYPQMVGLIAQEVEEIVPEVVGRNKINIKGDKSKEVKRVYYENLVALLIDSIQEQQKQIEKLEQRITELEENK